MLPLSRRQLISPTTVAFDADDYGDVLRFFYFVI